MTVTSGSSRTTLIASLFTLALIAVGGCQRYVTPAAGVGAAALIDMAKKTDPDIAMMLNREPVAPFPAHLAIARIQASGYYSRTNESYGYGQYSIVTTPDVERDEDFQRIAGLPMVQAVAHLNRLVIPAKLESDKELRQAAAAVKADLLLIYTFDTSFRIKDHDIGPLGVITLGFLPNQEARVTTTASAALYDVRTGYVYGLAEATAREKQIASVWTSQDAVDETRLKAERQAFEKLLEEFEKLWKTIVETHATKTAGK